MGGSEEGLPHTPRKVFGFYILLEANPQGTQETHRQYPPVFQVPVLPLARLALRIVALASSWRVGRKSLEVSGTKGSRGFFGWKNL